MKLMKRSKKWVRFGLFCVMVLFPLCGCVQTLAVLSVPITTIPAAATQIERSVIYIDHVEIQDR